MFVQPLSEGEYFHIYNRGINGENIFKEKRNYHYFLQQYKNYCSEVFETFAYALLKNHFHLLVYVNKNVQVPKHNGQGMIRLSASRQLSHFFNSYAQSVNKACQRTGPLFENSFERRLVDDNSYFTDLICYCHSNPQIRGFVKDFSAYEFTSYNSILANNNSFLEAQKVLDWFGGADAFEKAHNSNYQDKDMRKLFVGYG